MLKHWNLKHLSVTLATLALTSFLFVGCDGSNITECTADADCPAEQPVCDTSSDPGICVPEDDSDPECEEDDDCGLADSNSGSSAENCGSNDDCDAGDNCVEDSLGVSYCVIVVADQATCDAVDAGTLTTLTDVDGGTFTGCLQDGTCTEDGTCE